jgi:primosomal protein N' (replication factor Y)
MKNVIAEVAVPISLALDECFDYRVPASMISRVAVGSIVIVPMRQKIYRGYVRRLKNKSPFENRLKAILKVLDIPLIDDPDLLALAEKIREDYFCSFADAMETILPAGVKRSSPGDTFSVSEKVADIAREPVMSDDEKNALKTIQSKARFILIRDQLPERRWVFYSALIKKAALEKKSVIVLVPDHEKIAWVLEKLKTPQEPILLGSNQKPKEARAAWLRIKNAESTFVIGTRSAIFAPARNLGLIIVDEEDHFAYHQEQVPHYHARDMACFRAQKTGARVVFGSITPSLEITQRVQGGAVAFTAFGRTRPGFGLPRQTQNHHENDRVSPGGRPR